LDRGDFDCDSEYEDKMKGLTEINKNLEKSFKGTFRSALKNGYEMDKHYVIVNWVYFHQLLKEEVANENE
jgi:hypothetical protein